MLVHRRQQPKPQQHTENERTAQPREVVHLRVHRTSNNDLYELQAMPWQPLVAVRWLLAGIKVAAFDDQLLALRSSAHSTPTETRPLSDDFATLQSLGVTGNAELQLDRSHVQLIFSLPPDVVIHTQPLTDDAQHNFPAHYRCREYAQLVLHVQLHHTVGQLKEKLQQLSNLPANRMLFRFHHPLFVDVDDTLTLAQLGFDTRGQRDETAATLVLTTQITVRLLPGAAAQPPTAEQQSAVGLVQVGVRVLAVSGRVHRMWMLRSESIEELKDNIHRMLGEVMIEAHLNRFWSSHIMEVAVGGRRAQASDVVADIIRKCDDPLPIVDVIIKPFLEQSRQDENDVEDEEEGKDEVEEEEAAVEDIEQNGDVQDDRDEVKHAELVDSNTVAPARDDQAMSGSFTATACTTDSDQSREPYAASDDKGDDEKNLGNRARFCLHPQHRLSFLKQCADEAGGSTMWHCQVCGRSVETLQDLLCWRCTKCKWDVCGTCFARVNQDGGGEPQQLAAGSTHSVDPTTHTQQTKADDENSSVPAAQEYHTSAKYAWLPSDFLVHDDGTVQCLSYINNLHTVQHAAMYPLIEQVVSRFIPLFERVLTSLRQPQRAKVPVVSWYDAEEEAQHYAAQAERRARLIESEQFDEEEQHELLEETRSIIQPDIPPFAPPSAPTPATIVSLRGRQLQLIIKLADIVLTPERPSYSGGVWHVEGMRNECIVASAIAYYDQHNIGPSSLAFRTAVSQPDYNQNDHRGVKAIYGLENEGALVEPLGAIDTCQGRCITFPNIFQHRVAPFSLLDASQPGHRSILVAFLVDPHVSVISTSRVPPQQAEWMVAAENGSALTEALGGVEVLSELVQSYVDWPMSRSEAEQHREKLMHERKYFVQANTEAVYERAFNLCEH